MTDTTHDIKHGDNLKIMQGMPTASIDLCYMDPPYFSQASYGQFEDKWESKDEYLDFMRPILQECQRVLANDWAIYVQVDDSAVHYLRVEMDEIFGASNFRNNIIWLRTNSKGNVTAKFGRICDHILFYGNKKINTDAIKVPLSEEQKARYSRRDDTGQYQPEKSGLTAPDGFQSVTLTAPGARNVNEDRASWKPEDLYKHHSGGESALPWRGIMPQNRHWNAPRTGSYADFIETYIPGYKATDSVHARLDLLDANGFIYWSSNGTPRLKRYLQEDQGMVPNDLWTDIKPPSAKERGKDRYPTQKPVKLLERIIKASSDAGDTVLDPFCGSGTAIVAAKRLGRSGIGIDCNETAVNIARNRVANAELSPDADITPELPSMLTEE